MFRSMYQQPVSMFNREILHVLRSALLFPGRVFQLPLHDVSAITSFALIGNALLNPKNDYFTPNTDLSIYLSRTRAKPTNAMQAAYHFYPQIDERAVQSLAQAATGQDDYATLFVACKLREQVTLLLTGPGIPDTSSLQVDQLPAIFWQTRQGAQPPGWDLYLIDGHQIVGLPRTIKIEIQSS